MKFDRDTELGALLWLTYLVVAQPTFTSSEWGAALLLFAPLVLLPSARSLANTAGGVPRSRFDRWAQAVHLPAAAMLMVSFLLPVGAFAEAASVPWYAVTFLTALDGLHGRLSRSRRSLADNCFDGGRMFLVVAGIWIIFARRGATPFGFSSDITLLTGVHFHYAGFILPVLVGLGLRDRPHDVVARAAALGTLVGIPLTAVGITTVHFGGPAIVETACAWFMAAAGFATAWLQLTLAGSATHSSTSRTLSIVSAAALAGSMGLAMLYGARFYWPLPELDIPTMRALHGTANAFGFALCGLAARRLQLQSATTA